MILYIFCVTFREKGLMKEKQKPPEANGLISLNQIETEINFQQTYPGGPLGYGMYAQNSAIHLASVKMSNFTLSEITSEMLISQSRWSVAMVVYTFTRWAQLVTVGPLCTCAHHWTARGFSKTWGEGPVNQRLNSNISSIAYPICAIRAIGTAKRNPFNTGASIFLWPKIVGHSKGSTSVWMEESVLCRGNSNKRRKKPRWNSTIIEYSNVAGVKMHRELTGATSACMQMALSEMSNLYVCN